MIPRFCRACSESTSLFVADLDTEASWRGPLEPARGPGARMRADGGADVEAPVDVTRQLAGSGPEAPKPPALAAAACSMCVFLRQGSSPPRARGCGAAHSVASSRALSCVPRSRLRRPASSRQRRRRPSVLGSAGGLSGFGGAGGALRRDGPVDEEADRGRAGAVADSAAVSVALDGEQAAVVQLAGEALGP